VKLSLQNFTLRLADVSELTAIRPKITPSEAFGLVETFFARSIDSARAVGALEPTGLTLLFLSALRFLAARQSRTNESWHQMRNRFVHQQKTGDDIQLAFERLIEDVEKKHPVLTGVFRDNLAPRLKGLNASLMGAIVVLDPLGEALASDAAAFGAWFDSAIDATAGQGTRPPQVATPRRVAKLMVDLGKPQSGESVHDASAGLGTVLAMAAKQFDGKSRALSLSGQEKNPSSAAVAQLRLYLLAGKVALIKTGDILRDPLFVSRNGLDQFDVVFCDPPYGQKLANIDFYQHDAFKRFRYGPPDRTSGEVAFLQHVIACLKPNGRAIALLSHGPLFRAGNDAAVRKALVSENLIDTVIGLPYGTLPGLPVELALVICRHDSAKSRKDTVFFVDASHRRDAVKSPDHWHALCRELLSACVKRESIGGFSRVVESTEIAANAHSLQPRRYVVRAEQRKAVDVEETLAKAMACEHEGAEMAAEMDQLIKALDLQSNTSSQ
jgi:type I restriction enzyme M protein